ncbi:hypothetical protein KM043_001963 [Ampulex compressa]|nr:hypothetical protein KM043_001963 [Ampulex compressa]
MPLEEPHGIQGSTLRAENRSEVWYKSYRRGRASGFAGTRLPQWPNDVARELFQVSSGAGELLDQDPFAIVSASPSLSPGPPSLSCTITAITARGFPNARDR